MSDTHPIVTWVNALRSGQYSQCRVALRDQTGFCCLGVANDLWDSSRWISHGLRDYDYPGAGVGLHPEAEKWLGLKNEGEELVVPVPHETYTREEELYMGLNDSYKKSFDEIADAIEANHPELFKPKIRMATFDGTLSDPVTTN